MPLAVLNKIVDEQTKQISAKTAHLCMVSLKIITECNNSIGKKVIKTVNVPWYLKVSGFSPVFRNVSSSTLISISSSLWPSFFSSFSSSSSCSCSSSFLTSLSSVEVEKSVIKKPIERRTRKLQQKMNIMVCLWRCGTKSWITWPNRSQKKQFIFGSPAITTKIKMQSPLKLKCNNAIEKKFIKTVKVPWCRKVPGFCSVCRNVCKNSKRF